ncbi:MAG: hypothetical protein FD129_1995 [bacterium]|nr:MAG: hypothetical protein FD129_1995 [bacterium]
MGSLTYTIDKPAGIVRLHYSASPDWPEMSEVLKSLLEDPGHAPGMGILADRSRIDAPQTVGYIRQIIAYVRKHQKDFGDARWALVVNGAGPYGMGRMAQMLGDDIPTMDLEIFDDVAEAEGWLLARRPTPGA